MIDFRVILAAILTNATRSTEISCLNHIMEVYFKENTFLLYTTSGTEPPITELMETKKKTIIQFYGETPELGRLTQNQSCDLIFYNFQATWELWEMFNDAIGTISGKVVVTVRDAGESVVREIIEVLWNVTRATDVIVLLSRDNKVEAYTWFPYRAEECLNVRTLTVVDVWREGKFAKGNNLFPAKVSRNLNGCDLRVTTRPMEPYVFPPNPLGKYENGYEVKILQEFSRVFNFTLRYILPPDLINFWNVGNASTMELSAFGMLQTHKVDLAFGAMMLQGERYAIAEALYPHTIETLLLTYPKPGFKGSFHSIYSVFSPTLWLVIILFHLFAALGIYLAYNNRAETKRKCFSSCFFNCIAILCNNVNFRLPKSTLLRILVLHYVIYAYHLSAAYQSYLFLLLTHSERLKPAENLTQLVDKGWKGYLFYSGRSIYNQSEHDAWNRMLQPEMHTFIDGSNISTVLSNIAADKKSFLLFSWNNIRYLSTVMFPDEGKSIFSHLHFFTCPVTMYMSPGNPLQEIFSRHINYVISTGILRQWKKIINSRQAAAAKKKLNVVTYVKPTDAEPLTVKHLEGAFILWFLLLSFSFLVFVVEIIMSKFLKKAMKSEVSNINLDLKHPQHRALVPNSSLMNTILKRD